MDLIIVGAGPSGCRTAQIVAKHGYDVLVLEEHSKIGTPTQCTGLVSEKIEKIPKKLILNKIKKARFCCDKEYFEIKSKKKMLVLDRKNYDVFLAERAKKTGAKFKLSTRFLDFKCCKAITTKGNFETKVLVGADGPNSSVAKAAKIKLPENLLLALQVRIESKFDSSRVELHFGSRVAPSGFAWIVPENEEIARVGLMCERNPEKHLNNFLKRFDEAKNFDRIGDVIRYGKIKESVADKVILVGDAACQIKPFSAGGLVYNKIGAEIAGKAIVKAFEQNDFSKEFFLENYDKKWKKELAWPIQQGLFFKWIFSQISDMPFIFYLVRVFGLNKLADFLDVDLLEK